MNAPMSKHLMTEGRKDSLLTGRNFLQNQAQGGGDKRLVGGEGRTMGQDNLMIKNNNYY